MSKPNRRELLKAIGAGTSAMAGLSGMTVGGALADDASPVIEEVTGPAAKRTRALALKSKEFKAIRQHVKETHESVPDVSAATVFKRQQVEAQPDRYGIQFPVKLEESIHSHIVVVIQDGSVTSALFEYGDEADDRLVEYSQAVVDSSGSVSTETIDLDTTEARNEVVSSVNAGEFNILVSDCSLCIEALKRICPWGCGISGALLCALIGIVSFPGGLGCGAFFAIYCFEVADSGACWVGDGPREDCEMMDFC